MRRVQGTLAIGVALLFLIPGCRQGKQVGDTKGRAAASIAGTYACVNEEKAPDAPILAWELREDGTLKAQSPPDITALGTTAEEKIVTGTWSTTGTSGKVTSENVDYPFTVDGKNLVFRDGKFVCRPAEPESGEAERTAFAGTYVCAPEPPPDDPNWPGPEDFELKEDGTLAIGRGGKVNLSGTWKVEGKQVVLQVKGQGTDRFDIQGDRLIGAGDEPAPGGGKFICNKKSS